MPIGKNILKMSKSELSVFVARQRRIREAWKYTAKLKAKPKQDAKALAKKLGVDVKTILEELNNE